MKKKSLQKRQVFEKTEGYQVVVPWLVNSLCRKPGSDQNVAFGKELPDDQYSCAGSVGSQLVSLGGWGAQICKDLSMAEKA